MSLILHIDSALDTATVALAEHGKVMLSLSNPTQKDHAQFLHPAIQKLFGETGISMHNIDAVAVVTGPGSYTGLRVGMAAAKGLCYALQKPLIGVGTLNILAHSVADIARQLPNSIICPMIDARRMEVFCAMMNQHAQPISSPEAVILNTDSFKEILDKQPIVFTGNGAQKFKDIISHSQAHFHQGDNPLISFTSLSHISFEKNEFLDIHLSEPTYVKEHESISGEKKS